MKRILAIILAAIMLMVAMMAGMTVSASVGELHNPGGQVITDPVWFAGIKANAKSVSLGVETTASGSDEAPDAFKFIAPSSGDIWLYLSKFVFDHEDSIEGVFYRVYDSQGTRSFRVNTYGEGKGGYENDYTAYSANYNLSPGEEYYLVFLGETTFAVEDADSQPHTHLYGASWQKDAANHWHECECGEKTDVSAHTPGDWIVDTAATATAAGSRHKECAVCGYVTVTEVIPATDPTDPVPNPPTGDWDW